MGMVFKSRETIWVIIFSLILAVIKVNIIDKNKVINDQKNNMKTSQAVTEKPKPRPEKIAYITIDDGPSSHTSEIVEVLKENDVNATFFMIDGNMKSNKEAVKEVVKEGNSVGFHSVSHDIHKLYESPETTLNEFETCKKTFEEISGKKSKLIRLPYGSKPYMPEESYNKLMENDYKIWDWSLDTEDWRSSTDQIINNVLYYGRDKKEIVILMHEKEQSVNALSYIIKVLKERGYTILPITEEDRPKNYWNKNI